MNGASLIGGVWQAGQGPDFHSTNPATSSLAWIGREADAGQVHAAVAAARAAFPGWNSLGPNGRMLYLKAYAARLQQTLPDISQAISRETGKPLWESRQEAETMVAKVANSIEAYQDRCAETAFTAAGVTLSKRFRPHGVAAVLGPFNLPGHLPHSHIVPALLAGNTIVYKPSELTPGVGQATTEAWVAAGLPSGVLNLVQGGRNTGATLASHPDIDALYFTGSRAAGVALSRLAADRPGLILALELGGNNPLVIWDCVDTAGAALLTVQSAFITAGQRCTCARRLIVPQGNEGQRHLDALLALVPRLRAGAPADKPEPFLGTLISSAAADKLMAAQAAMAAAGGKILVPMRRLGPALLSPGVVDMTDARAREDEEHFGPLLQVFRVGDFGAALDEANHTRYGLAAGLLSDRRDRWESFREGIRAGIVNWNRPTTGASGKLPFGGVGDSGNHRPSAYYAADYCAYPVASMEAEQPTLPGQLPPGIDPA